MLRKRYSTWADMNELLGWDKTSARLSQIYNKTIRSDRGTPYVMGDETAREIERCLSLPMGWMDTPPSYAELSGGETAVANAHAMIDAMEPEQIYMAVRLLDALQKPKSEDKKVG